MAEAISAQERARAAGAVAASGVFSDAAGVGTFASSAAAAMARCGGGPNEEARGYPFSGETRALFRARHPNDEKARRGSAGSVGGSLAGGTAAERAEAAVSVRECRAPREVSGRAWTRAGEVRGRSRGPSEFPRDGCRDVHRKSEAGKTHVFALFAYEGSVSGAMCVFFSVRCYTRVQHEYPKSRRPSSQKEKPRPRLP